MRFERPIAIALVLALLASSARSDPILSGEILDFGVIVARHIEDLPMEGDGNLAPQEVIEDIRHLEHTDHFEARLCRRFGMTVRLTASLFLDIPRTVEGRAVHPTMTRPDGRQATEARGVIAVSNGVAYVGFGFSEEWEMVAGQWTLILSLGDEEIIRKDFTVTVPAPGAPNSGCGLV